MATVGYGLALGQDISFYKTEYKIQDIFVADTSVPPHIHDWTRIVRIVVWSPCIDRTYNLSYIVRREFINFALADL